MEIFRISTKNIKTTRKCLFWIRKSLGQLSKLYGYTGEIFSSFKGQKGGEVESHFVRSIRGLPNFLAIPIMNPLTRVHDENIRNVLPQSIVVS